jgi:Protein of unknown function (DUF2796)
MVRAWVLAFSALLTAMPVLAEDKSASQQPKAHQHGAATLEVTLDGGTLQIALDGPGDNFLGFEHAPRTDAEKKTVARVEQQLKQPAQLLSPSPAAACQAEPPRVEIKLPTPGSQETHSDIEAEWSWRCGQPGALAHVDVELFKRFPRLKELRVQIATPQTQKTLILKPGAPRIRLGP